MLDPLPTIPPYRRFLYQTAFGLAAVYNLAFGAWAGFFPDLYFRWLDLELPRYPAIWACLGMVVGVYGLLYAFAALRPEHARPVIAVGLLGKVLGPIGMVVTASEGVLPSRAFTLCVFNDLIWWVPFGLFMLEGTALRERLSRSAPLICAVTHAAALATLPLVLAPGTELEEDVHARAHWLLEHKTLWRAGWAVWMASAMSLVGFYAWWGSRLPRGVALAGVLLGALGALSDMFGETLLAGFLIDRLAAARLSDGSFALGAPPLSVQVFASWWLCVFANGWYTIGGIVLTVGSRGLPRLVLGLLCVVWVAGIGMTLSGLISSVLGVQVTSALLFPALIAACFFFWLGRRKGGLESDRSA